MIKTQAYNDFSFFSYEQRRDTDFMLQQLKEFTQNGGDATLMVRLDNYGDKAELITFRDFTMKYIPEPELFFKSLMKEGIIPGLCDFKWDPITNSITETKDYGLNWMSNNYNEYSDIIKQSLSNLLNKIPEDISQITKFNSYDYYGKIEESTHTHPLFKIAEKLDIPEIYEMIFFSKPQVKEEWLKSDRKDKKPIFISTIEANWGDIRKPSLGIVFYKHDICKDYMHKKENEEQLHTLISHAVYLEDYDFLNQVLPLCNLQDMEKNQKYGLSLSRAKTSKMVNLLLDHNAIIEQKSTTNKNSYDINVFSLDEFNSVEAFDTILQRNQKYRDLIKNEPNQFYQLMTRKNFDFSKLLIEKYEFPLENYDMLSIAWKNEGDCSWLVKQGADTRECESFCSSIVSAREDGLKKLRALNKDGVIVAKSPDFIFNIFNSSPTKSFINYYDKLTNIELEKTTKKGLPAWWGAKTASDYKFMTSRISHPEQKAVDGKPYLFYALERELQSRGSNKSIAKEAIQAQVNSMKKKCPNEKLDLSFTDKNGNNFLHLFVKVEKYGKDSLDNDLIDILKEHSNDNPYSYLMKQNKAGISPFETLITQETKSTWSINQFLRKAIEEEAIDYTQTLSNKEKIGTKLLEYFKEDKALATQLHTQILKAELPINEENKLKKIKI
jgi:hypothetical protein